jgi:hypothetical protein
MAGRMSSMPREATEREREVVQALERGRREGQTPSMIAKALGISRDTLTWWSWRIAARRRAARGTSSRGGAAFVEVRMAERSAGGFEVVVEGGRVVRVPAGFDARELRRLLAALGAPC